jgi:hypothetical protein
MSTTHLMDKLLPTYHQGTLVPFVGRGNKLLINGIKHKGSQFDITRN